MTTFLLAVLLSAAQAPAAPATCFVGRAAAHEAARPVGLALRATAAPRDRTAVRSEAPLAVPVEACCIAPQLHLRAAYATRAAAPHAVSAAPRSGRAPPPSVA